ncbi:hypothetical protein CU669_04925 [Paramagnetospirillum kuznetsovii]|uniref:FeoB-associated Cys-rich membrane protein n=1 Tax=Paramagnetospirillum kuznetsovii TaxID=2053833 RepID=A0A364P2T7_9PROT|nr:hypothetical protein CU669_04925 [Paramagnetospirillum kuznetsovii]
MLTVACPVWQSEVPGNEVLAMLDLWDATAMLAVVVLVGAWAARRFYRGKGCGLGCGGCKTTRTRKCE